MKKHTYIHTGEADAEIEAEVVAEAGSEGADWPRK